MKGYGFIDASQPHCDGLVLTRDVEDDSPDRTDSLSEASTEPADSPKGDVADALSAAGDVSDALNTSGST